MKTLSAYKIKKYKDKLKEQVIQCKEGDKESGHSNADDIILDILKDLGLESIAEQYREVTYNSGYA